eukprot:TRINITY_DN2769_c0_g1_i1.p1 TRINITY_DN2769_c0_g1~~TRINITY_DN2769_c0_g1_i1.p1  ORF type:complete len:395 (-),score=95.04 TRINITY_DN2769_c0_g1_i1:228-1412(-)
MRYLRARLIVSALLIRCLAAEDVCDVVPTSRPASTCSLQAGVASEVRIETASASLSLMQIGPPEISDKKPQPSRTDRELLGLRQVSLRLAVEPAALQQLHEPLVDAVQNAKEHRFNLLQIVLAVLILLGAAAICIMYAGGGTPRRERLTQDKLLPPVSGAAAKVPTHQQQQQQQQHKQLSTAGASIGGSCCCGDGVGALLRRTREEKQKPSNQAASTGVAGGLLERAASQSNGSKDDCHADFSGTWQCVKADGDLDAVCADIGLGMIARTAIQAFGYGAGRVIRVYEQKGDHVKVTEKGLEETVEEWDIIGEEQLVDAKEPFLQTTYWDKAHPKVLVMERKDVHKKTPGTWTTTRQCFLDSKQDEFVLEVLSSRSNVARWTYQRITDKGDSWAS